MKEKNHHTLQYQNINENFRTSKKKEKKLEKKIRTRRKIIINQFMIVKDTQTEVGLVFP